MSFVHRRTGWPGSALRLALLALLVCGALPPFRSALAAPAATVVISPTNAGGWGFLQETATGSGSFVTGPAGALGSGSTRLAVDGTGGFLIGNSSAYLNTRLDALTEASYRTYRTSGSAALAVALQLGMDYNLNDDDTSFQGRLVFEPHTAGTVVTGAWQTWNPLTSGKWFASRAPFNSLCSQAAPCTWAQVRTNWPNAGIHASAGLGGIFLKAGGGWTGGFDGNVDALTVGVGGNATTFDFEPEPACAALCYVNGATGNDANGGNSAANAKKTIQAALDQVSADGTVRVAAGTYNENLSIAKNGLTLEGAGAGSDAAAHTIVNNAAPAAAATPGISVLGGVTGVTITGLRVQGFAASGIRAAGGNNDFTVDRVDLFNNAAGGGGGGLYMNGPVSTVVITGSNVQNNTARGIVIWNGFKQDITISNNTVRGNVCCGIELQDGTASGVTITGNTIENNGDNGIGVVGLTAGAGPNLIAGNTLRNNGRFGIEVKLPNGTGLESGDGSIVVRDNTVERTAAPGSEQRDLAGIAVFRRGWVAGNNNVDIPAGVIVRDNLVTGFQQPSDSDGFGIVVEGTNMAVYGNTVTGSDVGIQRQAGNLPYAPSTSIDGDQSNKADQYFGRGNSPAVCAVVSNNFLSDNTVNLRDVGPVNQVIAATAPVTNTDTGLGYCSIQGAIDAAATLDGHTISIGPGTFRENVTVHKSLTLRGAGRDATTIQPALAGACRDGICAERVMVRTAAPIIAVRDLTLDGDNPTIEYNGENPDAHYGVSPADGDTELMALTVDHVRIKTLDSVGVRSYLGRPYTVTASLFEDITAVEGLAWAVFALGEGLVDSNTFISNDRAILVGNGSAVVSNNSVVSSSLGIQVEAEATNSISVIDNSISACTGSQVGVGIDQRVGSSVQVDSNRITGCRTGIELEGASSSSNPTAITSNEIDAASAAGSVGILVRAGTSAIVLNNILANAAQGVVIGRSSDAPGVVEISTNAFLNTAAGVALTGTGQISATATLNWWGS
ncbi:MAG TPA: right-handed parallel beta-helix repeat-containing protein, partial [Herpetosiphonaceae bacterium]|nr:right-handed parallel beta-helix repeat-containing protein [Herpetosiphonaceae bacterium]